MSRCSTRLSIVDARFYEIKSAPRITTILWAQYFFVCDANLPAGRQVRCNTTLLRARSSFINYFCQKEKASLPFMLACETPMIQLYHTFWFNYITLFMLQMSFNNTVAARLFSWQFCGVAFGWSFMRSMIIAFAFIPKDGILLIPCEDATIRFIGLLIQSGLVRIANRLSLGLKRQCRETCWSKRPYQAILPLIMAFHGCGSSLPPSVREW